MSEVCISPIGLSVLLITSVGSPRRQTRLSLRVFTLIYQWAQISGIRGLYRYLIFWDPHVNSSVSFSAESLLPSWASFLTERSPLRRMRSRNEWFVVTATALLPYRSTLGERVLWKGAPSVAEIIVWCFCRSASSNHCLSSRGLILFPLLPPLSQRPARWLGDECKPLAM